jgi:Flp pilus assembly pilin Flp
MLHLIRKLFRDEGGATAVEYAVMLAFVILSAWLGIQNFGNQAVGTWDMVGNSMGSTPFGS